MMRKMRVIIIIMRKMMMILMMRTGMGTRMMLTLMLLIG